MSVKFWVLYVPFALLVSVSIVFGLIRFACFAAGF